MNSLISIIIPTFQRRDKLKIALMSVMSQTYRDYEVLIMDDGSTDGTDEMVYSFKDSRIFYNWQKNTGGPAKPRNDAIKIAKGEWVAFLDDDDQFMILLDYLDNPQSKKSFRPLNLLHFHIVRVPVNLPTIIHSNVICRHLS